MFNIYEIKNVFLLQNFLFFFILILRIFISLSSDSLLGIWIGIEINLFTAITIFNINQKTINEKSIITYFLVQRISSVIILFSILFIITRITTSNLFWFLFILSIFIKLGVFPFHFWILTTIEGLSWIICFILLRLQKIIPLIILILIIHQKIIMIIVIINRIVASLRGLTTFSLRKILGFSSINHLSLILLSVIFSKKLFKTYFLIYIILTYISTLLFQKINANFISQIFLINNNKIIKLNVLITFFRIAGIPPFLGFLPKFIIIVKMTEFLVILPIFFILIRNTISTFFYIRLCFSSLFINFNSRKIFKIKTNYTILPIILIFSPLAFLLWNFKL